MPWLIGIDEAGYGPNLGPFVMTLVACRLPGDADGVDLWKILKKCVRRADDEADHRLVVADSKQVYSPAQGWTNLEKSVLSAHAGGFARCATVKDEAPAINSFTLQSLLEHLACDELPHLRQEAWFVGDTALPTEVTPEEFLAGSKSWRQASERKEVTWGFCRSAVVATPRFNDVVAKWDNKAAVLGIALAELIRHCLAKTSAEPMLFVIDKHGGRDRYSALLQHAFTDGMVLGEQEGRARSHYSVEGLDRPVRITVMPKADVEQFTVALASMFSKYLRELLMREFNRYWQSHVPGLKATAGYPLDADRYYAEIRPAMAKLGIAERLVWRSR